MTAGGRFGLVAGPLIAVAIAIAPVSADIAGPGQRALAVMALCMVWWLTTPVAMPVTSLLGMALLPLLGVLDKNEAMALFGNQSVFFVIAAFIVAAVTIRTGLSTRIALWALRRTAHSEDVVCAATLLVAGGLTSVIVSHAVAALLLPIMMEILRAMELEPGSRFARRLLLSMAWGTICGSNLTLLSSARASLAVGMYASYNDKHGITAPGIGFFEYSAGTAWTAIFTLVIAYFLLRWYHRPEGLDMTPAVRRLEERALAMGAVTRPEWLTAGTVIAMVAALVTLGPTYGLGTIALAFAAVPFMLQVMKWEDAEQFVNWGVALLYGGAIAVSAALEKTHVIEILVKRGMPDGGVLPWVGLLAAAVLAAGLTEFVSNAAVIALLLPLGMVVAPEIGVNARAFVMLLPAAAGLAYALPMSTPAMAMVFGTGYLRPSDSAAPGIILTAIGIVALVLVALLLWPVLGIPVIGG